MSPQDPYRLEFRARQSYVSGPEPAAERQNSVTFGDLLARSALRPSHDYEHQELDNSIS